jgi:hypothetical protein
LKIVTSNGVPVPYKFEAVVVDYTQDSGTNLTAVFNAMKDVIVSQAQTAVLSEKLYCGLYGARFLAEIYTRGCHWFPRLLASSIPLGCLLFFPVHTVNCVQTLKGFEPVAVL